MLTSCLLLRTDGFNAIWSTEPYHERELRLQLNTDKIPRKTVAFTFSVGGCWLLHCTDIDLFVLYSITIQPVSKYILIYVHLSLLFHTLYDLHPSIVSEVSEH